jgi:hypothetical protein
MNLKANARALAGVALGVAALLLKGAYHGEHGVLVASYLGNVSASFAVYFMGTILARRPWHSRLFAAASALLVVEAFELADGFGVMSNTYDLLDLVANVVGVALALGSDALADCLARRGAGR